MGLYHIMKGLYHITITITLNELLITYTGGPITYHIHSIIIIIIIIIYLIESHYTPHTMIYVCMSIPFFLAN